MDESQSAAPLLLVFWWSILGAMALMLAITLHRYHPAGEDAEFKSLSYVLAYVLGGCAVFSSTAMNTGSVTYATNFTALLFLTMPYVFRNRGNSALLQKPESQATKLHLAAAQLHLVS